MVRGIKRSGEKTKALSDGQDLEAGQEVAADVQPRYPSLNEVLDAVWGLDPDAQYLDRDEAWGDFGEPSLE